MGKIAQNYFYNVCYQLLVLIAPIITAPYLARVLGAGNLGIYSYVNSSGNIITTVTLLGIYAYGNRQTAYVRENKCTLTSTFWEIEAVRLILGTIGTLVYIGYSVCNKTYNVYFLIYYPYILAQFIDCSWLYVGLEDMKPAVIKNAVTKLINIAGIFIFVKKKDDIWIYIAMLAATTLFANISIYTQLPKYIGKLKINRKRIPHHIKGSLNLFLPQVASLFYLQVDKVMLTWLTGRTEQVSFYDQAEKIVTIPLSVITVISTVMMPRIANEYKKNHKQTIENLLLMAGKFALCLAMPMMLGIFCIAGKFIPWYLGTEFQPTSTAIMVLSPIIVLNSLSGISGNQFFTATDQTTVLMKAYVSAAGMNVVANAVLIPHFGYVGAAAATVMSSLCSVIIQYHYMFKQLKVQRLILYAGKYFTGAVIMSGVIFLIGYVMKATAVTTVIQILIGGGIYFVFLLIVKDEMLKEAHRLFKKIYKH